MGVDVDRLYRELDVLRGKLTTSEARARALERALSDIISRCRTCGGSGWKLLPLPGSDDGVACPDCSGAQRVLNGEA